MATLFEAFHSDASHNKTSADSHTQNPGLTFVPQFPQEILDHIVDYFHDQPEALRICSLVSCQWLESARAHIFYRITLTPQKTPKRSTFFSQRKMMSPCQKLYRVIDLQSRLGNISRYIREIHLQEGVLDREWIAQERNLPLLLRAMNGVRRLEITGAGSTPLSWRNLTSDVKSAVLDHTLKLESFSELRLSNFLLYSFEDMANILCACRDLRILEVDHVLVVDDNPVSISRQMGSEMDARRVLSLDTLAIGPRTSPGLITSFLLHSSSPVTLDNVRKLCMSISGDFAKFAKLLHASTSVEKLEVALMSDVTLEAYWDLPPTDWLRLSEIPCLRDLKVNIDILQRMEDPLPWLTALLRTGKDSRHNAVKTISVLYSLYLPSPYMDRYTYNGMFSKWSEIDGILCDVAVSESEREEGHGYQSLESVKLEFALENPIGFGIAPRFLNKLVLDSPALRSKGILHVHAFDTSR